MMLLNGTTATPAGQTFAILLVLISPAVGSFLGVLVDRMARGESVIRPRSACRSCATPLTPFQLVPILSYLRQRGLCRNCAAPIPPATLYLEIAALGVAILAGLLASTPMELMLIALIFWCLLTLGSIDLIWFRLPDLLTLGLFLLAMVLAALGFGHISTTAALIGAALGAGAFWIIRTLYHHLRGREGLGMGDVKLMAGLGALHGAMALPEVVLIAALAGLAWGAVQARIGRGALSAQTRIPFGAFLCVGSAIVWLAHAG